MEATLGERQKNFYMGAGMTIGMMTFSIIGLLIFVFLWNNTMFLFTGPAIGLPTGMSIGISIWRRRCSTCEGPTTNIEKTFIFVLTLGTLTLFVTGIIVLSLIVFI